jgi:septum formation protein
MKLKLVLASQSPRRSEILQAAGIPFTIRVPQVQVEEIRQSGEPPLRYVRRLATEKAAAVNLEPGEVILGADTVVVYEGHVLEKPRDAHDALRMLSLLNGREHDVITGICLRTQTESIVDTDITRVRFSQLTRQEITGYIASGEPTGKAGAYAIQGLASKFIERIDGSYSNVVGLPVALVYKVLRSAGDLVAD